MYTDSLAKIYDSQAAKFSQTRNKHRPELDIVVQKICSYARGLNRPCRILEVGCGDGRLWDYLLTQTDHDEHELVYHYTGIDISQGLLSIARQRTVPAPHHVEYRHQDMGEYLSQTQESSRDIVVGIASVQHLFPASVRQEFFDNAQRALQSGGLLILTNRSRSDRAREKYRRPRYHHLKKRIQTRGKRSSGDQLIPRIDPQTHKTYQRYYHFFSLEELETHLATGWQIHTLTHILKTGEQSSSARHARNSLVIASTSG